MAMKAGFARWVHGRDEIKQRCQNVLATPQLRSDSAIGRLAAPSYVAKENAERAARVERVRALDPETCSVAELRAALGAGYEQHGTLTCCGCGVECGVGLEHEVVLRLGDEPDYEAQWVDLCPACAGEVGTMGWVGARR